VSDFWKQAVAEHDHQLIISLLAAGLRLDEARDVAQEAWLRVMESASAGRLAKVELPGLVIRQASFIVVDRHRARRLRVPAPLQEVEALPAPETAEGHTHARELLEVVNAELATATPRARGVFLSVLRSPDEAHQSLAAKEGLSLQRFRQVLCEVRAKLRRGVNR
jgi:DNA-directed RNA polymerase specialized sigma24 family protein